MAGTANADSSMHLIRHSADAVGPQIRLAKSRHATIGSHTIVQACDVVGTIGFYGDDGVDLVSPVAEIRAVIDTYTGTLDGCGDFIDAAPGANDMPGRLEFYTTPDGTQASALAMSINNGGIITTPKQPAFLETIATTIANETGDGTSYVVVWDNEVFDQNADFATSTFTAPVTGRYRLSLVISLSGIGSGQVDARVLLTASNRVVQHHFHGYNHRNGTSGTSGTTLNTLMDMDETDTVTVTAYVGPGGQSKDVDIEGTGSSNAYSLFSGELVA